MPLWQRRACLRWLANTSERHYYGIAALFGVAGVALGALLAFGLPELANRLKAKALLPTHRAESIHAFVEATPFVWLQANPSTV